MRLFFYLVLLILLSGFIFADAPIPKSETIVISGSQNDSMSNAQYFDYFNEFVYGSFNSKAKSGSGFAWRKTTLSQDGVVVVTLSHGQDSSFDLLAQNFCNQNLCDAQKMNGYDYCVFNVVPGDYYFGVQGSGQYYLDVDFLPTIKVNSNTADACQTIACSNDSECNDSNPNTRDVCHSPGALDSYCSNEPIVVERAGLWLDGGSVYWSGQLEGCSSKTIKFLRADGSTRLAKAVSDLEYQYCPYFSDWERAILLCGSREVGVILKNSEQLTQCFDSDGGSLEQNFGFVLGATNQSANEITGDYCDGSYLVEGICNSSGQYEGQRVFCPEGCLQGICLGNPYQKATLTMSGSTVNYSDAVRGTGGLMHIKFFKSNGCNALSRKITSSEGSYMPSFDWSFVVLQQFYSGKGYVDISNTLTN